MVVYLFKINRRLKRLVDSLIAERKSVIQDGVSRKLAFDSKNQGQSKRQRVTSNIPSAHVDESKEEMAVEDHRPYMQTAVDDIDSRDIDNPLLVTNYVNEMYDYLHQIERDFTVDAEYMLKQNYVNEKMRAILVNWLVSEIQKKFVAQLQFKP